MMTNNLIKCIMFTLVISIQLDLAGQDRREPKDEPHDCILRLELPAYPPLAIAARLTGEARVGIVLGQRGAVVTTNIVGVHDVLKAAIATSMLASRFSSSCSGVRISIQLVFMIGGEPADHPVPSVAFTPPNRFIISSQPLTAMP